MTTKAIDGPAHPNGMTRLEIAVENLDVESARAVLGQGADPNRPGYKGFRPLQRAVDCEIQGAIAHYDATGEKMRPRADMTRLLLEHGADPKAQDDEGHSALGLASLFRHMDAVELMKQYGEA